MLFRKGTGCVLGKRTLPEPPGRGRGGKGNGLQLQDTGKDEAVLELLKAEYGQIRARLEALAEKGTISEYIKCTLVDMSNKVLENIARKYDSVRKGVKAVMGGKVLEYEAKTIREKGIEEGIEKGMEKGVEKGIEKGIRGTVSILKNLGVPLQTIQAQIQEQYGISPEALKKYL